MMDMGGIRSLLVAATAAGEEMRPLMAEPDMDPKMKAFGNLCLALVGLTAAIVEKCLVPMTGGAAMDGSGRAGPPPPPKPSPGLKELRECLDRADTESVLFDANLGPAPLGNRNSLANSFSAGIRAAAIDSAMEKGEDPAEAIRALNDALDCVTDMDFIGLKSEMQKPRPGSNAEPKNYCTMPLKLRFEDRNSRLHFERTMKSFCGLRAVMSLPKKIRDEQSLFAKALRDRYPDEMVTVRPDTASLHFVAFKKRATEKRWARCSETLPIPHNILLPEYKGRAAIILSTAAEGEPSFPVSVPEQNS
jgi:hypothetical protein